VLCTDRRSGMLGVYLASPLDRDTYLLGKALAIASVLAVVCVGPPLLMLIANILQNQGPTGFGDIALTTLRVLVAGGAVTLLYTGITMGAASLTDRKAIATAAIILLFLVTLVVAGSLGATGSATQISPGFQAVAPTLLSLEVAVRVHGESSNVMPGASSFAVWAAWAAWTFGGFALARFQLHRLPVTR
jgi:ABC-type transport system involved in multi-copper enzyme maturation permease subunit